VAHALINPHGIFVLLLTDKRIFYLKRDELFGSWDVSAKGNFKFVCVCVLDQ